MHPHFARYMTKYYMIIFQFYFKCCIGQSLKNFALHLYGIFFSHKPTYVTKISYLDDSSSLHTDYSLCMN